MLKRNYTPNLSRLPPNFPSLVTINSCSKSVSMFLFCVTVLFTAHLYLFFFFLLKYWHVNTAIFKIDNQQGPTVKKMSKSKNKLLWHKNPTLEETRYNPYDLFILQLSNWTFCWSLFYTGGMRTWGYNKKTEFNSLPHTVMKMFRKTTKTTHGSHW